MKTQKYNTTTQRHVKHKENGFRDGLSEIANNTKEKKIISHFALNRLLSFMFSKVVFFRVMSWLWH